MVSALAPFAIFAGVAATTILAFFSFWGSLNFRATAKVRSLSDQLERAAIKMSAQDIVLTIVGIVALVWISIILLFHPGLLVALVLLPVVAAAGAMFFYAYLNFRIRKRL